ncbi:MAG: CatB-related O-acetyltransferase [Rickettsiaceae bacterium]|nr:CatB-related O-acetyltransferase [Rickettsiaceae bacterium]MCP5377836.1 CatB-related O-acetyltransferase [Rickettsiaceae bacterium]
MEYVNPDVVYPIENWYRTCFLKNIITNPQIIVGDYTYYDDTEDVYNFEKNVLYLFDFIGDKLIIGKFCQIASGVRFIMNGANHAMGGISTYPFEVFGKSWSNTLSNDLNKGDTVIGNDVWIGNSATIMPGVKIGHGAIIGTNTLVTKDVAPYTIVGGNPGKLIRNRFDQQTIDFLLELAWWDWPIERITKHVKDIASGNLETLRAL